MMDVRLALIRISCHDIIKADPVSMAEEIASLKREVAFLKKRQDDAINTGNFCRTPVTADIPREPAPDAASEGFFHAGDMQVPFSDFDMEKDFLSIPPADAGTGTDTGQPSVAEAKRQGAGGFSAGKGVMQTNREEEERSANETGASES